MSSMNTALARSGTAPSSLSPVDTFQSTFPLTSVNFSCCCPPRDSANGARCLPGALPAPHLLGPPPPPAPIPGRVPPPSTSPAAGSERDRQQCLRSGDYDVDASPPTTAENGFLGLCKRICLSVGAKLCRSRLWLALFIYFLVCFLWSSLLPPSAKMQGAGVLTINW